ncbi:hypothetical protein CBR_g36809 [Chara braunii]|uniref:Right handed beta helix domain-containing protein n=1 Tax=Chara braunii TaxID=69332 RepID=A0A388LLU2_CHABU|nr:hypothetical protein CBR_g36809 [Chara braunii]|eukprot:GBG83195.1 hypothetical protein CBR_g36809 [Chara braunii]
MTPSLVFFGVLYRVVFPAGVVRFYSEQPPYLLLAWCRRARASASSMAGGREMSSSRRSVSLLPLLRLLAIATLFIAIAIYPAEAVPANNFADLKRLLADTSVSAIEVKADIKLTEDLPEVRRSIRIVGQCPGGRQCVVDGDSKYRIFLISGSSGCTRPSRLRVDISNLRLINARSNLVGVEGCGTLQWDSGPALSLIVVASATLRGVNFEGNVAPAGSGGGLAVYSSAFLSPISSLDITNCVFRNNRAAATGGGIDIDSGVKTTITSSTFIDNAIVSAAFAGGGGALSDTSGNLQVIGCKFQNNTNAFGLGGAINIGSTYGVPGRSDFQSNTFEGNSAKEGGAISVIRAGVSICKNTFTNNVATGAGSAIRRSSNVLVVLDRHPAKFCPRIPSGTRTVCVRDYKGPDFSILSDAPCTVSDQVRVVCGNGGSCMPRGVDIRTPTGRLASFLLDEKRTKLTLTENVVLTEGLPHPSPLKTKPITITGKCPRSPGGRCVIDGQGKFTAFVFPVHVTMENIEFRRAALTAVEADDGFVGRNLVFARNRRTVNFDLTPNDRPYTAGLFITGNFTISDSTFRENSGYSGAALGTSESDTFTRGVISKCMFSKNVAARFGAAVDLGGERRKTSYRVADSTFMGNTAADGGALTANNGQVEIVRSTFKNNKATRFFAGAVRIDDYEKFSLCNCQFSGNTAKESNSSNLFVSQVTTIPAATLFCPTQPPLTEFNCNFNGDRDEPFPCFPITVGGPGCASCL